MEQLYKTLFSVCPTNDKILNQNSLNSFQKYIQNETLKQALRLPIRTPNEIVKIFLQDYESIQSNQERINILRITDRINREIYYLLNQVIEDTSYLDTGHVSCVPSNIRELLYLQGKTCVCHNNHLTFAQICKHSQIDSKEFLRNIYQRHQQWKKNSIISNIKRRNTRKINQILENVNKIVIS